MVKGIVYILTNPCLAGWVVKRTVQRVRKLDELPDAMFFPGHQNVDY